MINLQERLKIFVKKWKTFVENFKIIKTKTNVSNEIMGKCMIENFHKKRRHFIEKIICKQNSFMEIA